MKKFVIIIYLFNICLSAAEYPYSDSDFEKFVWRKPPTPKQSFNKCFPKKFIENIYRLRTIICISPNGKVIDDIIKAYPHLETHKKSIYLWGYPIDTSKTWRDLVKEEVISLDNAERIEINILP